MNIHYAIKITTPSDESLSSIGMFKGTIRFISDNYTVPGSAKYEDKTGIEHTSKWYSGFLLKDKIGSAGSRIDITQGGDYAYLQGWDFQVRNKAGEITYNQAVDNILTKTCIVGSNITLYVVIDDMFYPRWSGVVSGVMFDDIAYKFVCEDKNLKQYKLIPKEEGQNVILGDSLYTPLVLLDEESDPEGGPVYVARIEPCDLFTTDYTNNLFPEPGREQKLYVDMEYASDVSTPYYRGSNKIPGWGGVSEVGVQTTDGTSASNSRQYKYITPMYNEDYYIYIPIFSNITFKSWIDKAVTIKDVEFLVVADEESCDKGFRARKLRVMYLGGEINTLSQLFGGQNEFDLPEHFYDKVGASLVQVTLEHRDDNTKIKLQPHNIMRHYKISEDIDITNLEKDENGKIIFYQKSANGKSVVSFVLNSDELDSENRLLVFPKGKVQKIIFPDHISKRDSDHSGIQLEDSIAQDLQGGIKFDTQLNNCRDLTYDLRFEDNVAESERTYDALNSRLNSETYDGLSTAEEIDEYPPYIRPQMILHFKDLNPSQYTSIKPFIHCGFDIRKNVYYPDFPGNICSTHNYAKYDHDTGYWGNEIHYPYESLFYTGRRPYIDKNGEPIAYENGVQRPTSSEGWQLWADELKLNVMTLFKQDGLWITKQEYDGNYIVVPNLVLPRRVNRGTVVNLSKQLGTITDAGEPNWRVLPPIWVWQCGLGNDKTDVYGRTTPQALDMAGEIFSVSNLNKEQMPDNNTFTGSTDYKLTQMIIGRARNNDNCQTELYMINNTSSVINRNILRVNNGVKQYQNFMKNDNTNVQILNEVNDVFAPLELNIKDLEGSIEQGITYLCMELTTNLSKVLKGKAYKPGITSGEYISGYGAEDGKNRWRSELNRYIRAGEKSDDYRLYSLGIICELDVEIEELFVRTYAPEDSDGKSINSVYTAFKWITTDYNKIDCEYNNLPELRHDNPTDRWNIGRVVTDKKNSFEYIKELCNHSYVAGWTSRTGGVHFDAFIEKPADDATFPMHDPEVIIRNSIKSFGLTALTKVYNEFVIEYDWNNILEKFNGRYAVNHVDELAFPNENDLDYSFEPITDKVSALNTTFTFKSTTSMGNTPRNTLTSTFYKSAMPDLDWETLIGTTLDTNTIVKIRGTLYSNKDVCLDVVECQARVYKAIVNIPLNSDPYMEMILLDNSELILLSETVTVHNANFYIKDVQFDEIEIAENNAINKKWKSYVEGIPSYDTAKSIWNKCHSGYLTTQIVQKAPDSLTKLYWYNDMNTFYNTDTYDVSDNGHYNYLTRTVDWLTRQKYVVSYSLALNKETVKLELMQRIDYRDKYLLGVTKSLEAVAGIGWITKILVNTKTSTIDIDILFETIDGRKPRVIDITSTSECGDIIEDFSNTKDYVEKDNNTDLIIEGCSQ